MKEFVIRTPQQLGPVLQGFRKTRRLTQARVGQAIGAPQGDISKLELDPSRTSLSRIFKLLSALDLELVLRPRDKHAPSSEW
jgi:HTH-type transcriptional regulator / antitoxin HipB